IADVLHHVLNLQTRLAEPGLHSPAQQKMLAENRGLQDLALGPQDTLVPIPSFAVPDQAGRPVAHPAVLAVDLFSFERVVEVGGAVLGRTKGVVETAGGQQSTAERAQESQSVRFEIPRAGETNA